MLNRFYALLFLAVCCVSIGGCSGFGKDSGTVYILYAWIIPKEDHIPVDAVNEFLLQEGYTSRVMRTWYRENGYSVQKIYLGEDVDPSPLLNGLRDIPGVLLAELDMDTKGLRENPPNGYLDELES